MPFSWAMGTIQLGSPRPAVKNLYILFQNDLDLRANLFNRDDGFARDLNLGDPVFLQLLSHEGVVLRIVALDLLTQRRACRFCIGVEIDR